MKTDYVPRNREGMVKPEISIQYRVPRNQPKIWLKPEGYLVEQGFSPNFCSILADFSKFHSNFNVL